MMNKKICFFYTTIALFTLASVVFDVAIKLDSTQYCGYNIVISRVVTVAPPICLRNLAKKNQIIVNIEGHHALTPEQTSPLKRVVQRLSNDINNV